MSNSLLDRYNPLNGLRFGLQCLQSQRLSLQRFSLHQCGKRHSATSPTVLAKPSQLANLSNEIQQRSPLRSSNSKSIVSQAAIQRIHRTEARYRLERRIIL